jgi:hypothetical protein
MTEDNSLPEGDEPDQTWTVVIYGPGYWGCGNSHQEAASNAAPHGYRKTGHHILMLFSEPVKDVSGSGFGLRYSWVDKVGVCLEADINGPKPTKSKK